MYSALGLAPSAVRHPLITAPTLILRGGPGSMVDPTRLTAAVDVLGDVAVHDFTCGHSIHRDRHREFEATVLPFLT